MASKDLALLQLHAQVELSVNFDRPITCFHVLLLNSSDATGYEGNREAQIKSKKAS